MNVFISYGRQDALDFAKRLAVDLQRAGQTVFLDLESIEKGGLWEVRIEKGIQGSAVLAAVMTPHSLREDSVCRDEVVFALIEEKPVIPLKADPDPKLKPSLLLARRNWIDFSADYDAGLQALLRYLDGDKSVLREPALPFIAGVIPLDFSLEIARYTIDFTGREWVNPEIDRWLATDGRRALVIVAEPGVGKSAIAAWLTKSRPDVVGIHFCTERNTRTRDPFAFVANLVGQLHARLPGYDAVVEAKQPDVRRPTASDAFRELIVEVAPDVPRPDRPMLIVVDSMDEALQQAGETVLDVLENQASDLPDWLRIVATTRPEQVIRDRIKVLNVFELLADRRENRADVRAFLDHRLSKPALSKRLGADTGAIAARLEALSEGNFLYARLALDALEDGSLSVSELERLSPGLAHFYSKTFRRRFPDVDAYEPSTALLLRALAAAREPLPFAVLQRVAGAPAEVVRRRLNALRSYLRISGQREEASYAFYHKSLKDWLIDPEAAGDYWCQAAAGHARLSEALRDHWRTEAYGLRHLAMHLAHAERSDELARLLLDFDWLQAKVAKGLVYELQLDFDEALRVLPADHDERRALQLVGGALRLSAHVLAKDATQLSGQLIGRLGREPRGSVQGLLAAAAAYRGSPWLRPTNTNLHPPGTALLRTLEGHTDCVTAVAVTPDGKRAVSASWDKTLKLWDLESGVELRTLEGHTHWVMAVAVTRDGKQAVSASGDHSLKVWDLESGRELRTLQGHTDRVEAVAVTPDGKQAVSASFEQTLKVWDLGSGNELRTLQGHTRWVRAVAVTPDGKRAVSASGDDTLKVWDLESGSELRTLEGHTHSVTAVAVTPDGKRTVSASEDCSLKVWDLESGRELRTLEGHTATVDAVAVTPDGKRAVSASADRTLRLWDLESGVELRTLEGHTHCVTAVVVTPDGKRAVSASLDDTLKVWDLESGSEPRTLEGHTDSVGAVVITPDGNRAVSASRETLKVWDLESGSELRALKGHTHSVTAVVVTPDGKHAVSASEDRSLKLWDLESGTELRTLQGHASYVVAVAVTPDGKRAVSGSWARPPGTLGVPSTPVPTLKVWDLESGSELRTLQGHMDNVVAVAVTPDGKRAASASWDRTVKVWDLESGSELHTLRHTQHVGAVAVTPDGKRAVSASGDDTLKVWDLESGAELRTLEGHTGFVKAVAVTPDGKRAVSASADRTLRLWDLESGAELRNLEGHADWVNAVAVTPDGSRAVSASSDKTLKLWNLGSGEVIATFSGDGGIAACATANPRTFVAGESSGRVHFLRLEGVD